MTLRLDDVRALFERRRTAWLAEDVDGYLACFSNDVVLEVPGRTVRGRVEYEPMTRSSFSWARPRAFEFHHLALGDDDVVMADWTITVERRSDGTPVTWRGMSVCTIVDARITTWREYYEDPVALGKAARGDQPTEKEPEASGRGARSVRRGEPTNGGGQT